MKKKFISFFMIFVCILFISACGKKDNDLSLNNGEDAENIDITSLEKETTNTIVATYNGVDITRDDIGSALFDAEKDVISKYVYNLAIEDFFNNEKNIFVTDEEIDLNVTLIKEQVGEENWDIYLFYYANGSDEYLREEVKKATIEEAYINQVQEMLSESLTKEVLTEIYNEDPDANNIVIVDVIPLNTEEELNTAKTLIDEGKTLEEMSEILGSTILNERYAYFDDGNTEWSIDLHNASKGDMVHTSMNSGTLFVGRIVSVHIGIDDDIVYDTLFSNESYYRASKQVDSEIDEFLENVKVSIFGVESTVASILSGDENG